MPVQLELGQFFNEKFRGLGNLFRFFSPKLTNTQKRYTIFERELYAAYAAVRHFRHFLEGRRFYIFTDHKPLVGAFRSNSEKYSPREVKHLDYLLQFISDIRQLKGVENIPAVTMSRTIDVIFFYSCIDMIDFMEEQLKDQHLQKLLRDDSTFRNLAKVRVVTIYPLAAPHYLNLLNQLMAIRSSSGFSHLRPGAFQIALQTHKTQHTHNREGGRKEEQTSTDFG